MSDTDKSVIGYVNGKAVFAIAGGDGTEGEGEGTTEETPPEGEGAAAAATEKDWKVEAEKWKAQSRKHEKQAKDNADAAKQLKQRDDADKTESQRLSEASAAAEKRAADAETKAARYEVAVEKSVPSKLMKFLVGSTREELEASADELLEAVKPDTGEDAPTSNAGGKPKEKLRSGAANADQETDDFDPEKVAADIRGRRGGI